jgi:poly(A) polymerase
MLDHAILTPVLPEIGGEGLVALRSLIVAESEAGIPPEALRRLSALLGRDPKLAEAVAVRLKLSTKARKRLACAAGTAGGEPRAMAYRAGTECAIDRLLLAGRVEDAAALVGWTPPQLPIGGGALIGRGLSPGPIVAKTLRKIENSWIDAGFPGQDQLESIVAEAIEAAR